MNISLSSVRMLKANTFSHEFLFLVPGSPFCKVSGFSEFTYIQANMLPQNVMLRFKVILDARRSISLATMNQPNASEGLGYWL